MKTDSLAQWQPCQSYCQMNGAAAAVLSFSDTKVLLNGPSWCSLVAERELMSYGRTLQQRLYSSHVEQPDLLFGTGEKIRELVEELQRTHPDTSLLAVLTSCSVGLIGDDVSGIVNNMEQSIPVIALDAGGLTGLFEEGYQAAMVAMLKKMKLQPCDDVAPKRVNLLGYCGYYPNSSGDLIELKRLLKEAGFEMGLCPGQHGLTLRQLEELPRAALNVVLSPELGLETAKYLKEKTEQEYAILPTPYGIKQTMEWLEKIGEKLSVAPNLAKLKQDASVTEENIAEEMGALKRIVPNLIFKEALLDLPPVQAEKMAEALRHGILEVEEIKQICQGTCDGLVGSDYRLLLGTFSDRMRVGDYEHTVYINMFKADGLIRRKYKTFVGIEGWGSLIEEIVEQILTLYYLKEERQKPL